MEKSLIKATLLTSLIVTILLGQVLAHPVEPGKFPWIVSIQRVSHFCAGSILAKRLILTSASCVKSKKANKLHVRAGSLEHSDGGQLLNVTQIINHPDFSEEAHVNDAAILVTQDDIEYNENAKPVTMANDDVKESVGTIVAGWKKWGGSKVLSNLRYTKITVYDNAKCKEELGEDKFIQDKMLCAGIDKVGKGMCKGDDGGPLIIEGIQYGIVSFGSGCEPPNKPGVYTDIHFVKDWIKEVAGKNNSTLDLKQDCKDFEC